MCFVQIKNYRSFVNLLNKLLFDFCYSYQVIITIIASIISFINFLIYHLFAFDLWISASQVFF